MKANLVNHCQQQRDFLQRGEPKGIVFSLINPTGFGSAVQGRVGYDKKINRNLQRAVCLETSEAKESCLTWAFTAQTSIAHR